MSLDCYKWAFKLSPGIRSELVMDCFELAREIRELDMRASPYDLADLGYQPVRIETPAGRAEYVRAQQAFAERAQVLRRRLVAECDRLLSTAASPGPRLDPAAVIPLDAPAVPLCAPASPVSAPAPSPGSVRR